MDQTNKYVFTDDLKVLRLGELRMWMGSAFHNLGAATVKNVAIYWCTKLSSLILGNNNMKSQNFKSFSDEQNIFLEHSGFPSVAIF